MSADTGHRKRFGRQHGYAPPCHRGGGLAEIRRFGVSSPASEHDADRAGSFGRELKPTRGCHRETRDLGDDSAQATVAQPFFHAGEHRLVVASLQIDETVGRKSGLGERWCEEIRARNAPQNLANGPGGYACGEQSGGGSIDGTVSATSDFMKRAEREAAAGETRVHLGYPEGKHRFRTPALAFDPFDLRAQRLYGGLGPQARS